MQTEQNKTGSDPGSDPVSDRSVPRSDPRSDPDPDPDSDAEAELDYYPIPEVAEEEPKWASDRDAKAEVARLRRLMREAAERLDFERAADLRDKARRLEQQELGLAS